MSYSTTCGGTIGEDIVKRTTSVLNIYKIGKNTDTEEHSTCKEIEISKRQAEEICIYCLLEALMTISFKFQTSTYYIQKSPQQVKMFLEKLKDE